MTWDEQKYSDEELKRYLNEWVEEHGEEPMQAEWNEQDDLPWSHTYRTRFGGWAKAKEELIDKS